VWLLSIDLIKIIIAFGLHFCFSFIFLYEDLVISLLHMNARFYNSTGLNAASVLLRNCYLYSSRILS